jgi:hypothetical protein
LVSFLKPAGHFWTGARTPSGSRWHAWASDQRSVGCDPVAG